MGKSSVLIVEDEKIYVKYLQMYLEDSGYDIAGCFDNADDALEFVKSNKVDVALLDINIKGSKDGIEMGEIIHKDHQFPFIYTSSMTDTETVSRAKHTRPAAYLVKPFEDQDLLITLEMALFNHQSDQSEPQVVKSEDKEHANHYLLENRIFIKDKFRFERVYFSDICYMEAEGNYVKVVTKQKQYLLAVTLGTLHERINERKFIRVHRSYVINLEEVEAIDGNRVYINDQEIPIGRNYREDIQNYFNMI